MSSKQPASKLGDILKRIRACVEDERVRFSGHALERMAQRNISFEEVLAVLRNGDREEGKDSLEPRSIDWKYAIRGWTLRQRELRVIVTFDPTEEMVVITVIHLNKKVRS